MIKSDWLLKMLESLGVSYFSGVPDSLLKPFCFCLSDVIPDSRHIISANEGGAVGLGIGYHLATNKIPLIYMQNSGLGNAINPLVSLADPNIYSIPMLLMIGWRGDPEVKDEPQHFMQGKITLETLNVLEIPYLIIESESTLVTKQIAKAVKLAKRQSRPVALIMKKSILAPYQSAVVNKISSNSTFKREDAIKAIIDNLNENSIVISTTGMASRELFEYRKVKGHKPGFDFLTVGGMGHASQIALGIANQKLTKQITCIDGDGAALMHLGSFAINGQSKLENYKHIVINNGAHDSVGGQDTVAKKVDLTSIANACGYTNTQSYSDIESLNNYLPYFFKTQGPSFLEIKVDKGHRTNLSRPNTSPKENKLTFMANISDE